MAVSQHVQNERLLAADSRIRDTNAVLRSHCYTAALLRLEAASPLCTTVHVSAPLTTDDSGNGDATALDRIAALRIRIRLRHPSTGSWPSGVSHLHVSLCGAGASSFPNGDPGEMWSAAIPIPSIQSGRAHTFAINVSASDLFPFLALSSALQTSADCHSVRAIVLDALLLRSPWTVSIGMSYSPGSMF
jgi:hypothetical protein